MKNRKVPQVSKVPKVSKVEKKFIFALVFAFLGFIALQIPVNELVGSRVKFTLFDLFAPISGAFLGTLPGIVSVFIIQLVNIATHGFNLTDKGIIIRLFPTLFGVWFFAKKEGKLLVIPALAIIAFNLHPIGRNVWFYSLFWTIPFIVWPFRDRFLIARSLGATFTAHSVGGAMWIWAFNLPANIWISLIPIVVMERAIFALGISASYVLFNNMFALLNRWHILTGAFSLDKKYLLKFLR